MIARVLGETTHMRTVLAPDLWSTYADRNQLESILLNLIVNARDAMPDGGRLLIETSNVDFGAEPRDDLGPGQFVLLSVSDTGCGIAREHLDKVFEPFFTTKEAGKGSGLGLSMVYGFVKQSGGHIRIDSEVGAGTTISVYLQRSARGEASERESSPASGSGAAHPEAVPGETILLVEDDDDVRSFGAAALESAGYRVLQARDGPEALQLLDHAGESRIDLLFTDIVLPRGMSGRHVADAVRARRPGLPVLFTSGYPRNGIIEDGRLLPDARLLHKPYTIESLTAGVRNAIDAATTASDAPPQGCAHRR